VDTEERVAQGERDIARLAVMERLEALGVGDQTASKALAAAPVAGALRG
jgi:hypothetical protein